MSLLWSQLRDTLPRKGSAGTDETAAAAYRGPTVHTRTAVLLGVNEFTSDAVSHIPTSVRNCQLLEDRLTRFGFDDVTVISSATSRGPTRENMIAAVSQSRRKPSSCDLLVIYISTHTYLANGLLYVVPSDYDPKDTRTHLSLEELVLVGPPPSHLRTIVILDGVHAPSTRRNFPLARNMGSLSRCNSLPPTVSLLCTPTDFEGSLSLKVLHAMVDLGEMRLPVTAGLLINAIGASAVLYPLQSSSHTVPIAASAASADSADQTVTFLAAISVATTNAAMNEGVIAGLLARALPLTKAVVVRDTVQPFVLALEGDAFQGPLADFTRHSAELAEMCERLSLPRITLHKSFYGRLYMSTAASDFAEVRANFQRKMPFGNSQQHIHYFGAVYRVEMTATYRDYLLCDALARLHISEGETRIRFEEVGPCNNVKGGQQQQRGTEPNNNNERRERAASPHPLSVTVEQPTNNNLEHRLHELETATRDGHQLRDVHVQVTELANVVRGLEERLDKQNYGEEQTQMLKQTLQRQLNETRSVISAEVEGKVNAIAMAVDDHERSIARLGETAARERADTETLRRTLREEQGRVREEMLQLLVRLDHRTTSVVSSPSVVNVVDDYRLQDRNAFEEKLHRKTRAIEDAISRDIRELTNRIDAIQDHAEIAGSLVPQQVARSLGNLQALEGSVHGLAAAQEAMRGELELMQKSLSHKRPDAYDEHNEGVRSMVSGLVQQATQRAVADDTHRTTSQIGVMQKQLDALSLRLDKEVRAFVVVPPTTAPDGLSEVRNQLSSLEGRFREKVQSDNSMRSEIAKITRDNEGGGLFTKLTEIATVLNELRYTVQTLQSDVMAVRAEQEQNTVRREKDTVTLTAFVQSSMGDLLNHQNKKLAELEGRLESGLNEVRSEGRIDSARRVSEVEQKIERSSQRVADMERQLTTVGRQAPDTAAIDRRVEDVRSSVTSSFGKMEKQMLESNAALRTQVEALTRDFAEGKASGGGGEEEIEQIRYKLRGQTDEVEKCTKGVKDARGQIDNLSLEIAKLQGFVQAEAATSGRLQEIDERVSACEITVGKLEKARRRAE